MLAGLQRRKERVIKRIDGCKSRHPEMPVNLQRLDIALKDRRIDKPKRRQPESLEHRQRDVVLTSQVVVEGQADVVGVQPSVSRPEKELACVEDALRADGFDHRGQLLGGNRSLPRRVGRRVKMMKHHAVRGHIPHPGQCFARSYVVIIGRSHRRAKPEAPKGHL